MKILCLNTSFVNSYVAVKNDQTEILDKMDSKLKQSENILELIDKSLKLANIKISDLDAISCVIGPGSFTGIRIGLSLVKGFLAPFNHIKFIPINSFELMAKEYVKNTNKNEFWCVINALSGKIFAQKYNSDCQSITEPMLLSGEELSILKGEIVGLVEENLSIATTKVDFNTKTLLEISENKFIDNQFSKEILPLYLRKSQAEDELDKKKNKQ